MFGAFARPMRNSLKGGRKVRELYGRLATTAMSHPARTLIDF